MAKPKVKFKVGDVLHLAGSSITSWDFVCIIDEVVHERSLIIYRYVVLCGDCRYSAFSADSAYAESAKSVYNFDKELKEILSA